MELPGLPPGLLEALVASAAGRRLALVGGAVRDLLLHQVHNDPWRGLVDLDLVLEGSAPELAERLRLWAGSERLGFCHIHGAYGTAELELDGVLLDLASARRESYPAPGENPVVRLAALADDLARRDFTINAIALELAPAAGGVVALALLDPHGGQADLAARRLRLLHGGSLSDDPTRVLRAARYAARLGFELAPGSLEQLRRTLAAWPWAWRPGDRPELAPPALGTRLRMELELLLEREDWRAAMARLQDWGALPLVEEALQSDRHWRRRLHWAQRFGLPLLPAWLAAAADPLAVAARLQLPHHGQRLLQQFVQLRHWLAEEPGSTPGWPPSRWSEALEERGGSAEAVALALAVGLGPRRPLLRWWLRWRHLPPPVTATELIAGGLAPGPALGQALRARRAQRLDQERR
ncbi:CCA tRNA nucleotidyltransferase [Cyanobium sp. Morenito 9A2]|uniref:CCA tRNA nucleotidyltransferase n=1 Tax=Cyanobium sp. Morenito 9A2 TaxID=2823718 RepID=UPI0020CD89AB|nr:CCA tRNA nucleotidyltransferase [Cyanobium sp. Morenito 9A2]MCP9849568.1 CCA tRNA nucleotidyltransferase [Cyanobium sp. Morenito 9A2]